MTIRTQTAEQRTEVWFPYRRPRPAARLRLFCFPYAGGSAAIFRNWGTSLPPEVESCAVQLPGRERRWREPAFTRMGPLVKTLEVVIQPLLDLPFAFFGHSLGAKVAFELARHLRDTGGPGPVRLFVSGSRAPHMPDPKPPIYALPDNELIQEIRELGGTPEEVLKHEELLALLLPLLRADLELNETYVFHPGVPLSCPMTAFGGVEDPDVPPEAVEGWREHTRRAFRRRMFQGGHFFLHEREAELLTEVSQDLLQGP